MSDHAYRVSDGRVWGHFASDRLLTVAMAMSIGALWLATRPYHGIVDDARFYMVEALRQLHPARFADDLYFRLGSQDRFTIFGRLYAPLVALLGIARAAMIVTLLGQLCWLVTLFDLSRTLFRPQRLALLALAAAIALPSAYSFAAYGYAQSFATPRLFAEALTALALAQLLRGRPLGAIAGLVAAAILHPLIALPGFAFAFLYLAWARPLWWGAVAVGLAAALGLAVLGVAPFADLRRSYDPAWLAVARLRDAMCFVTGWSFDAYLRVAAIATLATLELRLAEPQERRFLACALLVGLGGVLAALIGGDLAANVFVVEIQPWRALWLLALASNLFAAPALLRLWQGEAGLGIAKEAVALAVALMFLSAFIAPVIVIAAPMLIVASLVALWRLGGGAKGEGLARAVCFPAMALAGVTAALFVYQFVRTAPAGSGVALRAAIEVALAAGALAWIATGARPGMARRLPWIAAAWLLLAAGVWDSRSPWTRFVESAGPVPETLAALFPAQASVYWEGGVDLLWFRLQRPSYFSCSQGTGVLFSRATALDYQSRRTALWPLRTLDFTGIGVCRGLDTPMKPASTRADLAAACAAAPGLDDVVLTRPVEGADARVWQSPVRYENVNDGARPAEPIDRFFIYSCAGLR